MSPRKESLDSSPSQLIVYSVYFQGQQYSDLPAANLTNEISPLFRRSNFSTCAVDYASLEQVLRLASNFIELALPVFHSLIFSQLSYIPVGPEGRLHAHYPQALEVLTPEQVEATKAALLEFADHVSFEVSDQIPKIYGWCNVKAVKPIRGSTILKGFGSEMFISNWVMDKMVSALQNPEHVISINWHAFQLATTLVHERTHALVGAMNPDHFQNFAYMLGDAVHAEEGIALGEYIFGDGTFADEPRELRYHSHNGIVSKLDSFITYKQGPDPARMLRYEQEDGIYVRPGALEKVFVKWLVSHRFVADFLQDKFWLQEVRSRGRAALRPPLETGYLFTADREECMLDAFPPDQVQDSTTAVPSGYWVDEFGALWLTAEYPPPAARPMTGVSSPALARLKSTIRKLINALKQTPVASSCKLKVK